MNNWNVAGRIGQDAVLRYTKAGKAVAGFSLAVDQRHGDKKETLWVECSVWGERGEKIAQYLTKGTAVSVAGEAGVRVHEGKAYMRIDVREVTLLGGGQRSQSTGGSDAPMQAPSRGAADEFNDDLPFATRESIY